MHDVEKYWRLMFVFHSLDCCFLEINHGMTFDEYKHNINVKRMYLKY